MKLFTNPHPPRRQPGEKQVPALVLHTSHGDAIIKRYDDEQRRQSGLEEVVESNGRNGHIRRIELCNARTLSWANPDRVDFDSGCKTFDRQLQGLFPPGNLIANTFLSSFVRGGQALECNGFDFAPMHLLDKDLSTFGPLGVPGVLDWVRKYQRERAESVVLTVVFHNLRRQGSHRRVVHGALVMDRQHRLLRQFDLYGSPRSWQVMESVRPFLTDEQLLERHTAWQLKAA